MNCYKCRKKNLVSTDIVDLNIYDGLIPSDHEGLSKPDCDFDNRFSLCQECYNRLLIWIKKNELEKEVFPEIHGDE